MKTYIVPDGEPVLQGDIYFDYWLRRFGYWSDGEGYIIKADHPGWIVERSAIILREYEKENSK